MEITEHQKTLLFSLLCSGFDVEPEEVSPGVSKLRVYRESIIGGVTMFYSGEMATEVAESAMEFVRHIKRETVCILE